MKFSFIKSMNLLDRFSFFKIRLESRYHSFLSDVQPKNSPRSSSLTRLAKSEKENFKFT
jgi:hypothetical protein